jgi:hypothetical protein
MDQQLMGQYGNQAWDPMQGVGVAQGANQAMDPNGYMTMAGFQGGQMQGPDTQAYNQYQGMLADPTSMTANPAYKAIMDAATQATQRQGLARGGNGGGTILAELAKTGAGVAGQYLPQMASMYQQGAQQEIGNWQTQAEQNLGAGQLGAGLYGTAGNQALGFGNQAGQMYNQGMGQLGNAAQLGGQLYGIQNQANLGYGNLANNMWANQAQDQYNRTIGYGNMQNDAVGQAGPARAYGQMSPTMQYYQNQLTGV